MLRAARDLQRVSDRHAPELRAEGLDDVAERLEELVLLLVAGAQELEAALQDVPAAGG